MSALMTSSRSASSSSLALPLRCRCSRGGATATDRGRFGGGGSDVDGATTPRQRQPRRQPRSGTSRNVAVALRLASVLTILATSLLLLQEASPNALARAKSIESSPINLAAANNDKPKPITTTAAATTSDQENGTPISTASISHQAQNTSASSSPPPITSKSLEIATTTGHEQAANSTTDSNRPASSEPAAAKSSEPEAEAKPNSDSDSESSEEDDATGAGDADHDAADCAGLSAGESAKGARLSDNARLVNLQACLQKRVRMKLAGATRSGMELFEKLSLTGGCTSSLMNLMLSLGDLRAFAFKFLDASAKIPSGMMYGLLSDFGDFDQCLSIRSNARVAPAQEVEEGAYSGKYCLLSMKLQYHVQTGPNGSAPEGIYPDGVLWDELVKNYWTSSSPKGFQVGVCVPSRCTTDDLNQIYQLMASEYNFQGEISQCQDGNDLSRQHTPDWLQVLLIDLFTSLVGLNVLASLMDRYAHLIFSKKQQASLMVSLLLCFSLRRNWRLFLKCHKQEELGPNQQHQRRRPGEKCQLQVRDKENSLARMIRATSRPPLRRQVESIQSNVTQTTQLTGEAGALSQQVSLDEAANGSSPSEAKHAMADEANAPSDNRLTSSKSYRQLEVKISDDDDDDGDEQAAASANSNPSDDCQSSNADPLSHLSGLKLLVIVWITVGHSFLYPSANNYQYYRSIINMNITRDSVWFAATNFTLGIDMLLYMIGLVFVVRLASATTNDDDHTDQTNHPWATRHQTKRVGWPARAPTIVAPPGQVFGEIAGLLLRRVLRFWPTYLAVMGVAICVPLVSDGPMWPEMVEQRLGQACRSNWWQNLLMINNHVADSQNICLPSSWFVSVIMQCFLAGSLVLYAARRWSLRLAVGMIGLMIAVTSATSFLVAYTLKIRAPAIRMDESFVLEIDDVIYRLYTSTCNNLGPFLVGMLGGFALIRWRQRARLMAASDAPYGHRERAPKAGGESPTSSSSSSGQTGSGSTLDRWATSICQLNAALGVTLVAILVLSSVFHEHYTPAWAAIYWSCHRLGWALVTGYLCHQCAIGRWRLVRDLLALNSFRPLSKLIFIAYLVNPIFIHLHSGLVRDGLHVSIYNMLNIYVTRLVMTFVTALLLHLLVELPVCSLERLLLKHFNLFGGRQPTSLARSHSSNRDNPASLSSSYEKDRISEPNRLPLLTVARPVLVPQLGANEKSVAPSEETAERRQ